MPRTPKAYREPAANVPKVVYAITLGNILGTLDQYSPESNGFETSTAEQGPTCIVDGGLNRVRLVGSQQKKKITLNAPLT